MHKIGVSAAAEAAEAAVTLTGRILEARWTAPRPRKANGLEWKVERN